jgi:predicted PurR-regulated permease PerM
MDLINQLNPSYIGAAAQSLQNFASNAILVLIYLGFIIASRRGFGRKIVALFRIMASATRRCSCSSASATASSSTCGSRRSPA